MASVGPIEVPLVPVIAAPQSPEPAPLLQLVPAPNGDGEIGLFREGWQCKHFPGPRRLQRRHVFDDVGSYAAWLNRHAPSDSLHPTASALDGAVLRTEILLSPGGRFEAALDPGSAAGDVVVCDLVSHPRYAAWQQCLRRTGRGPKLDMLLSQRDLFALLRARKGDITDAMLGAQIMAAAQSLKLMKSGERQVVIDDTGWTRLTATSENRQISVVLPPAFSIRVPIFEGVQWVASVVGPAAGEVAVSSASGVSIAPGALIELEDGEPALHPLGEATYEIEVLLWLHETDSGSVCFELQAPALDLVMRQARRDAAAYLQALLSEGLMVGLGTMALENIPEAGVNPQTPGGPAR